MARRRKTSEDRREEALERAIHKAVRAEAWLLPENEDEVAESEVDFVEDDVELPESLADPLAVLNREVRQKPRTRRTREPDRAYEEELRRAAREGHGRITPEIEARMRRDRRAAEQEGSDDG